MSHSHQLSKIPSVAMRKKLSNSGQIHRNDTGKSPRFSAKLNGVWACGSEGERLTGSQKVVGSSPTRSTKHKIDPFDPPMRSLFDTSQKVRRPPE